MRGRSRWTHRGSIYSLIMTQTLRLQVAVIVLGAALPVLAVIPLNLQQTLIDDAIPGGDAGRILTIGLQFLAVVALTQVIKFCVTYLRGWIWEIVSRTLRDAVIEAQRHRRGPEAARQLGAVTSVITGEVEDLGGFAAVAINTPLIEGGTILSLLGFVILSEPTLAAIGIAALVAQGVLTSVLQYRANLLTRKRIKALRSAGLDMIAAAGPDAAGGTVAALHEVRRTYRLRLRMNLIKAAMKVLNNFVINLATISILCWGAVLVMRGEIGLGVVVAFLSGFGQINDHWGELLDFYRSFADARIKYRLVVGAIEPPADSGAARELEERIAQR